MEFIYYLQYATVVFGIFSAVLSAGLAARFFALRARLGHALGWMLLGEMGVSSVTVFFSFTSLTDLYNTMSPVEAVVLRCVMFSVVTITSLHLYRVMREV